MEEFLAMLYAGLISKINVTFYFWLVHVQ